MATLLARRGRHRQLYEDNRRLVSGCIPYKVRKGYEEHSIEDRLEVLMVSTPNRSDLVFPKGGWENDETVHEAARREAFEEAGVRGNLNEIQLGVWEFRSKSRQAVSSLEGGCRGYMFALEVTEELDTWPEQENHDRKWLDIREAFHLCRYEWMKDALRAFLKQMDNERQQQPPSQLPPKINNQVVVDSGVTIATAIIPVSDRQVVKAAPTTCSVTSNAIITFVAAPPFFLL
ncbi:nudix hydrolase 12, mitochondrial [Beta vulgaris subsp. vulgaris]|uniref:nudix hydrolase 12, mitochondrial n=1 Tax=Beta vulgaris subsp. vulgaris TaxID=3555 RepID=UPI002036F007|nr:nudix hydrolase 12, mitochondrial [Beta vulgaris subsp. vulgaris]